MNESEIYINEKLLDLLPGTIIALTYQINDLGNLQDRQGSYSNAITVPKTNRNRSILEFAEQITSTGKSPYRKMPCKYRRKGAELISKGFAIIEDSQDNFDITIYFSNALFFQAIQGLNLSDLDLTEFNFLYTLSQLITQISATSGTFYPIIDNNDDSALIKDFSATGNTGGLYVQFENLLPAIYVKNIIDRIFKEQNVKTGGKILGTETYLNLILPTYQQLKFSPKQIEDYHTAGAIANNTFYPQETAGSFSDSKTIAVPFTGKNIQFGTGFTFTDGLLVMNFNGNYFSLPYNTNLDINVLIDTTYSIGAGGGTFGDNFFLYDATSQTILATLPAQTAPGTSVLNIQVSNIDYVANHKLMVILLRFATPSIILPVTINNNSSFDIRLNDTITFNKNLPIYPQSIFKDMSQLDFIKSISNIFGLIPQYDEFTGTMNFIQFKELYENRSKAKDWTMKLDYNIIPKIEYRINSYAQNTYCRYNNDATVDPQPVFVAGNSQPVNYGDGSFTVDDETLQLNTDMINLPYAGTKQSNYSSSRLSVIKILEGGKPKNSVVQRILIAKEKDLKIRVCPNITNPQAFNAEFENCIVPYFIDVDEDINLGFDNNLLKQQYNNLTESMLKNVKMVTAYFRLTLADIAQFDHFIPVYLKQYGNYFYVNQIIEFVDETVSTKVILIRL